MKRLFLFALLLVLLVGHSATALAQKVKDGLYLIAGIDSTAAQRAVPASGIPVKYSKLFEEFKGQAQTRIVLDANEYVPLDLGKSPATTPDTKLKKKLVLTLTPAASEKLRTFTEKYLTRKVAVVVDDEVVGVHDIKEAITNGQLQITKCTANACERLYFKLEDNVKR